MPEGVTGGSEVGAALRPATVPEEKLSANNASKEQMAVVSKEAGITNAGKWAREVE